VGGAGRGRVRVPRAARVRAAGADQGSLLLSFATASSEAAYPKILDALDRFGVRRKISAFVMPMGYSFNLDGSMMYCTFAVLFIAQAYGINLPLGTQLTMLLILMLTSKGMAGVPRASLVVIAATLNQFNIPEAGLLLILGVDTFLDMGRSATNAVGNSIATAVVARWKASCCPRRRRRATCARSTPRRRRARMRSPAEAAMASRLLSFAAALLVVLAPRPGARAGAGGAGRAQRDAGQGARFGDDHARSPRVVDPVLVPVAARRADRLLDSTCAGCWSTPSARRSGARSRSAGSR